jgi:hypothetical protein
VSSSQRKADPHGGQAINDSNLHYTSPSPVPKPRSAQADDRTPPFFSLMAICSRKNSSLPAQYLKGLSAKDGIAGIADAAVLQGLEDLPKRPAVDRQTGTPDLQSLSLHSCP